MRFKEHLIRTKELRFTFIKVNSDNDRREEEQAEIIPVLGHSLCLGRKHSSTSMPPPSEQPLRKKIKTKQQ